jgi:hypothetical protein
MKYPPPSTRRLRVYAFDPQSAIMLGTVGYAYATIDLPWEEAWEQPLERGPVNEYFEVIDIDPASKQFYDAVDLNDKYLLAQNGLAPSEGNPQFHQQMVFAVGMKVVRLFERALGRKILWAPVWNRETGTYEAVKRLRIYPHAIREANAYYSFDKHALLFGYFRSQNLFAGASWIFTALSHDIIAHETTHAVLDGLHRRYKEATSPDSRAFHEAFADIVALFSHFTLTEAVYAHIQEKGGALDSESLLSGLARQFAAGTSGHGTLRQYIDKQPDPELLANTLECHDRGAILVAAVFDAFLQIYKTRTDDLLRIGKVERGQGKRLDSDLARRLTDEAIKTAEHVLRMCIRAMDYLPPVDVRFGEFLRAIITADADLVPEDTRNYRIAFSEAFLRRGITAGNCLSTSPESLLWDSPEQLLGQDDLSRDFRDLNLSLEPQYDRDAIIHQAEELRKQVWSWLVQPDKKNNEIDLQWEKALGVYFVLRKDAPKSIAQAGGLPKVEVHSVRVTRRAGPDGQDLRQLVIEVTQRRRGYFDQEQQKKADRGEPAGKEDFNFRGGATLIIDLRDRHLRFVIRKRIDDAERLNEQRVYLQQPGGAAFTYIPAATGAAAREPFAMAHRGG